METIKEGWLNYPIYSDNFISLITAVNDAFRDPICNSILVSSISLAVSNYARLIDIKPESFELSFLPKNKLAVLRKDGKGYTVKNRLKGKPVRILKKVLLDTFSDAEWEQFNNRLKSAVSNDCEFKLVKGNDIKFWYNAENYLNFNGTLGKSCMRNVPSNYFDLYDNEYCQMLILTKLNKLIGRALVWTDPCSRESFLDRVYYNSEEIFSMFISYASEHGWNIREDNSVKDDEEDVYFLSASSLYTKLGDFKIEIPVQIPRYYPYVDSFKFLVKHSNNNGTLTNIYPENNDFYILTCTDGTAPQRDTLTCDCCGIPIPYSCNYYSSLQDINLCEDCAVWSDYHDSYVVYDDTSAVYHDESRLTRDYVLVEYLLNDSDIVSIRGDYYFFDEETMVEIEDEFYFTSDTNLEFDEELGEYKIKKYEN